LPRGLTPKFTSRLLRFRKTLDIAACEQQRRKGYAALEDIRKVQMQRRVKFAQ
jgi:hypothetical protein